MRFQLFIIADDEVKLQLFIVPIVRATWDAVFSPSLNV